MQGWIKKIQKEGAESPALLPPYENFTFQDRNEAYSIVGAFVMHSKVMSTFRKIELNSIL